MRWIKHLVLAIHALGISLPLTAQPKTDVITDEPEVLEAVAFALDSRFEIGLTGGAQMTIPIGYAPAIPGFRPTVGITSWFRIAGLFGLGLDAKLNLLNWSTLGTLETPVAFEALGVSIPLYARFGFGAGPFVMYGGVGAEARFLANPTLNIEPQGTFSARQAHNAWTFSPLLMFAMEWPGEVFRSGLRLDVLMNINPNLNDVLFGSELRALQIRLLFTVRFRPADFVAGDTAAPTVPSVLTPTRTPGPGRQPLRQQKEVMSPKVRFTLNQDPWAREQFDPRVVGDPEIVLSAETLTPDGDGENDTISFDLESYTASEQVERIVVQVLDADGYLYKEFQGSGNETEYTWDGVDLEGRPAPAFSNYVVYYDILFREGGRVTPDYAVFTIGPNVQRIVADDQPALVIRTERIQFTAENRLRPTSFRLLESVWEVVENYEFERLQVALYVYRREDVRAAYRRLNLLQLYFFNKGLTDRNLNISVNLADPERLRAAGLQPKDYVEFIIYLPDGGSIRLSGPN